MSEYEIKDGPFATNFNSPEMEDILGSVQRANKLAVEVLKSCDGNVPLAGLILSGAALVPLAMGVIYSPERKTEYVEAFFSALRHDFEQVLEEWKTAVMCIDRHTDAKRPS